MNNLAVTATGSGTVTLTFTAPGVGGSTGAAAAYDLRYWGSVIDDQNWSEAIPATGLPAPLPAGSTQTITVSGLNAGAMYYFALNAMNGAGYFSAVSNTTKATTTIPKLVWGVEKVYWASWSDYYNRQLSKDFSLENSGTGIAKDPAVADSVCDPASVYVISALPIKVADLGPGATATVTLRYYVPASVSRFTSTTYASCRDDAGRTYWFPGPIP